MHQNNEDITLEEEKLLDSWGSPDSTKQSDERFLDILESIERKLIAIVDYLGL